LEEKDKTFLDILYRETLHISIQNIRISELSLNAFQGELSVSFG